MTLQDLNTRFDNLSSLMTSKGVSTGFDAGALGGWGMTVASGGALMRHQA